MESPSGQQAYSESSDYAEEYNILTEAASSTTKRRPTLQGRPHRPSHLQGPASSSKRVAREQDIIQRHVYFNDDIDYAQPEADTDEASLPNTPETRASTLGGIPLGSTSSASLTSRPPCHVILHRVRCTQTQLPGEDHRKHASVAHFRDEPRLFARDSRGHALRGSRRVHNVDEYLEMHPEVCMVVYRDYDCVEFHRSVRHRFERVAPETMDAALFASFKAWFYLLNADTDPAKPSGESLEIVGGELEEALDVAAAACGGHVGEWNEERNLKSPYVYFYHHLATFQDVLEGMLDSRLQNSLSVLLDYLKTEFGPAYDGADELFDSGYVTRRLFTMLFRAKEVVVCGKPDREQAYVVDTYEGEQPEGIVLHCWSWKFDGVFRKNHKRLVVPWPDMACERLRIEELTARPLRLDNQGLEAKLKARGEKFWSLRKQKLVSYSAPRMSNFELQTANPKYMVDTETYQHLHKKDTASEDLYSLHSETVSADLTDPPADPFLILLPSNIQAYGFHDKQWKTLEVAHITDIPWNKTALDRVVLKGIKKELIKALVTSNLEKTKAADVVENKGNGMILLLHGPPGTGKTLTAESVAEFANKPLYRVTCGDMGTEPETVEKYLEGSLYLGTIWGCVVLLDEADVFLEERTQTDLVRNALVSVFLRVLEYYEGILILTSNRVSTFDEAFKSRMQLAVHYPPLEREGRHAIWLNFFNALSDEGVPMNKDELMRKAHLLAEHNLNGRQIRNTIKTGRQLADYRNETFDYGHLESVIEVTNDFESYLQRGRGGLSEEDYAVNAGWRPPGK